MQLERRNLSILVVDDDKALASLYETYLGRMMGHRVEVVSSPGEAKMLALERMYDIVICDAKMPYKGSPLGGIILSEELSIRLGAAGVLLISQIVDATQVRAIETSIPFLKKDDGMTVSKWFGETLNSKIQHLLNRQFGFVAMPYGKSELDVLYKKHIVPAAKRAGFGVSRVDEKHFTKSIIHQIQYMIRQAHFVIFLTYGNNPNVFFEAGYALGLQKEIIMCTSDLSELPFDVREHKCLAYGNRIKDFEVEFEMLLKGLRGLT